jgi:hypothetical protein
MKTSPINPSAAPAVDGFVQDCGALLLRAAQGSGESVDFEPLLLGLRRELKDVCSDQTIDEICSKVRETAGSVEYTASQAGGTPQLKALVENSHIPRLSTMLRVALSTGRRESSDLVTAREQLSTIEAELAAKREELEETVVAGDIDRVMSLRKVVHIELPGRLAEAKVAVLDLEIERGKDGQTEMVNQAARARVTLDDARAEVSAAEEALQSAQAAEAAAQSTDHQIGAELLAGEQVASALRTQRDAIAEAAAKERTAAIRRLAGLDPLSDQERSDIAAAEADAAAEEQRQQVSAGHPFFRAEARR